VRKEEVGGGSEESTASPTSVLEDGESGYRGVTRSSERVME